MTERTKCGEAVGRPHEMDELLEAIWTAKEQESDRRDEILAEASIESAADWLSSLEQEKLITVTQDSIQFTSTGQKEAEQIIRRHRLAERLFADAFNTSEEVWEREACELEHQTVLVDEAVDAVCSFLGHPTTCPHGKPIPRGPCCSEFKRDLKPFVIPLSKTRIAADYRITFITPRGDTRLDRLAVLGILPGGEIRIRQKKPSYVIRIGETDVALDDDIVRNIFVKRVNN